MEQDNTANGITRRESLRRSAAAVLIAPATALRSYAANEKLNLWIIRLTGMGGVDAKTLAGCGENIFALCDVDTTILDKRGSEYPAPGSTPTSAR